MKSQRDEAFFKMRDDLYEKHPAVTAKAVIPTPTVLRTYALVRHAARRHRRSLAFWAHPMTGKSFCITAMEALLRREFPECAVVVYEAKHNAEVAQGTFLEDILTEIDFELPVERSIPGKRKQVKHALYALAAAGSRIVIFVDEAQELHENELRWLKTVINWCAKRLTFVTIVLFGQQELIAMRDDIVAYGRSDLDVRYTQEMYEFEMIRNVTELRAVLIVYDDGSEFPEGSGISYTEFLWPLAFVGGLRLKDQADPLWAAFAALSPNGSLAEGVSMQWVAAAIAEVAEATKSEDSGSFTLSDSAWRDAVKACGYADWAPTLTKIRTGSRRAKASAG